MESIIEWESKGREWSRVDAAGRGWWEVGGTSRQHSSTANGRKWTLVREEYAEREKTGKRKRADRWRHRGELGKTGDTFISEWRKGEKRRERERKRGEEVELPREIEVTGSLVVFLDRWQSARGWPDKRENTVPAGWKPMGTEGIHGTRETTLATGHSRYEIKQRRGTTIVRVGCARQCFLFKIDSKVKSKFCFGSNWTFRVCTRSSSGLFLAFGSIVGIYVRTEVKFLHRRSKHNWKFEWCIYLLLCFLKWIISFGLILGLPKWLIYNIIL